MKLLEIDIFFHSDQTTSLHDLDIDYPLSDCEVKKMTFYQINAVGVFEDSDEEKTEYTSIHSNGTQFISPLKYSEVKKLIEA